MTDIKSAFQNGKAFIPFVTAGDPDLETTEKLLIEMSKNGADIIEFRRLTSVLFRQAQQQIKSLIW